MQSTPTPAGKDARGPSPPTPGDALARGPSPHPLMRRSPDGTPEKDAREPSPHPPVRRSSDGTPEPDDPAPTPAEGCYLYCLVPGDAGAVGADPGRTGIGGASVEAVGSGPVAAIVHIGAAVPFETADDTVGRAWVLTHHQVVETAWRQYGTVLPVAFNTIVAADGTASARDRLGHWLDTESARLAPRLEALRGTAEYGVQIDRAARDAADPPAPAPEAPHGAGTPSPGVAYLQRRRQERLARQGTTDTLHALGDTLFRRLVGCTERARREPLRAATGERTAIVTATCLVATARYGAFLAELDGIGADAGIEVLITGPLPPYSFATGE